MTKRIEQFSQRAGELQQQVRALLLDVRAYLDETEHQALFEAESDLYDAAECLEDFVDSCTEALEA